MSTSLNCGHFENPKAENIVGESEGGSGIRKGSLDMPRFPAATLNRGLVPSPCASLTSAHRTHIDSSGREMFLVVGTPAVSAKFSICCKWRKASSKSPTSDPALTKVQRASMVS